MPQKNLKSANQIKENLETFEKRLLKGKEEQKKPK